MNSKLVFLLISISLGFLCSVSCTKSKAEDCTAKAQNIQPAVNTMNNAAIAYSSNPSATNCQNYKNATQAYINEARSLVSCTGLSPSEKTQYQQSLDTAVQNLSTLTC
jgi:hypothetical protein